MTSKQKRKPGFTTRTRRTSRIIDRNDPKVRLLALVFATRDNEVKQGSLSGKAATTVPATIARAVAKMLREIGEDPALDQDLVMTIGPAMKDAESRRQHEAFVVRLSEQLLHDIPKDPLQGMTVVVERRAKRIVGEEAAAVRRRASSSSETPPAEVPSGATAVASAAVIVASTTSALTPSRKLTRSHSRSKGRKAVSASAATPREPEPSKPTTLSDVFLKAMAGALKRLTVTSGPGFDQITFLEQALEGYQSAWSVEKRKSSQGLDPQAARAFESLCGDTYRVLREEAVRLGVPDASFTIDDMQRILKLIVQKMGLIIESAGGHVRLKVQAGRKSVH